MTSEELQAHEDRLNEIRMTIVGDLGRIVQLAAALKEYIKSHNEYLAAVEDRLDKHMEHTKLFSDMFQPMLTAFVDINITLAENNARTTQLISKVESYFGNGEGLEHEN